uniref:EF-hand domain-containing protein n=2 Tax=Prymnesium polylepis TaxID=72548 RepID=A0A7S4MIB0_9EUKA
MMPPVGAGPGTFAMYAFHWLITPWLAGSIWFYLIAKLTSKARAEVKTKLSMMKFLANFAGKTDGELIQAFKEIDADGGGALDNKELVLAWQKATGEELTPEQAQGLIDEVDEDKNGTLDQSEFIALIRKRCEQPIKSFADQFSDAQLKQIFDDFDDDGNNEMDADELVVAWKKVTNKKISTADAQAIINQGAINGNPTLDKDEFVQVVRAQA